MARRESRKKDAREEVVTAELEALGPRDRLLRKIGSVMDCDWLQEGSAPDCRHGNGRPGTDPAVRAKRGPGICPASRRCGRLPVRSREIWQTGGFWENLMEESPHFAAASYRAASPRGCRGASPSR